MVDVHTPEIRSRNMAAIRAVDTRPELALRRALFAQGYRYRLHDRHLPGRPDVVLSRYRAVIFVHGCFFHGHQCDAFRWPATRKKFWRKKIEANRVRDGAVIEKLVDVGWRVLIVWECVLRGREKLPASSVADYVAHWLADSVPVTSIPDRACK